MAHLLIALALIAWATPALADPIVTPLVTALLTAADIGATAGITIGAYTLTYGTILSGLVTTAIGIGLSLLFAPRPKTPAPENGSISVQQNYPYRVYAYGQCRIAGAVMLKEESQGWFLYVGALAGHEIDSYVTLYLNDDPCSVGTVSESGGGGTKFEGPVSGGQDGRYNNVIYVQSRRGLATETYINQVSSHIPSVWTVNHRGDGQASLGITCTPVTSQSFSTNYPYGAPMPSAVTRNYRVFDPRDTAQAWNNPATWVWSDNVALCILHFLCFSSFGFRYNYQTAILPTVDFWKTAANICDEAVSLKAGGTEARYRLGGWITTEQARATTLMQMLQSCDGFLSRRGASYVLFVGKYYTPTVTLTDDQIAGFFIQTGPSSEDVVNSATAKYTSPDNGYTSVSTDPIDHFDDQTARGGAPRASQLDLTWVQSTGQASRLLKREMVRQGTTLRGRFTIYWSGLNACWERFVAVQSNTIPQMASAVIEIKRATINAKTRTADIEWILSGSGIDTYSASTEESSPPLVVQRPDTVQLPIPSNVYAVGELITDALGASSVILAVSWDQPLYNGNPWAGLNYIVQWRLTNAGSGSPGPWSSQTFSNPTIVGQRIEVQTGVVPSGTTLDVQVSSVATGATLSTYSSIVTASTVLGNLAPAQPSNLAINPGTGFAQVSCTAPTSANVHAIQFFIATTGSPFSAATPFGSPQTVFPGTSASTSPSCAAGTYDFFAVSLTLSSISSDPIGPVTGTVF